MTIRLASVDDLWPIMQLYQVEGSTLMPDALFTDFERLKRAYSDPQSLWLVSERDGKMHCLLALLIDRELGVAKLSRMMIDPAAENIKTIFSEGLRGMTDYFRSQIPEVDLIYTTTFTLPMAFQKLTIEYGFKVLGVFPNAKGIDEYNLNGLSVYYMKDSAHLHRDNNLRLHPATVPLYDLATTSLGLNPAAQQSAAPAKHGLNEEVLSALPPMEAIRAPEFVLHRFHLLKSSRSQLVNFYPFYRPNCVITDPEGQIEVFLRIIPDRHFAAIIGERILTPIDPVKLFQTIFQIVRAMDLNYVELIQDAGDYDGTDIILRSGFTPCGYIPAFKKQGDRRRDYVVYGKAFEFMCKPNLELIPKEYIEFYKQYLRLEQRNYFKGLNFDISEFLEFKKSEKSGHPT